MWAVLDLLSSAGLLRHRTIFLLVSHKVDDLHPFLAPRSSLGILHTFCQLNMMTWEILLILYNCSHRLNQLTHKSVRSKLVIFPINAEFTCSLFTCYLVQLLHCLEKSLIWKRAESWKWMCSFEYNTKFNDMNLVALEFKKLNEIEGPTVNTVFHICYWSTICQSSWGILPPIC